MGHAVSSRPTWIVFWSLVHQLWTQEFPTKWPGNCKKLGVGICWISCNKALPRSKGCSAFSNIFAPRTRHWHVELFLGLRSMATTEVIFCWPCRKPFQRRNPGAWCWWKLLKILRIKFPRIQPYYFVALTTLALNPGFFGSPWQDPSWSIFGQFYKLTDQRIRSLHRLWNW